MYNSWDCKDKGDSPGSKWKETCKVEQRPDGGSLLPGGYWDKGFEF